MGLCCVIGFVMQICLYLLAISLTCFGLFFLLLKYSKYAQQIWFSYIYQNFILPKVRPKLVPFKDTIFKDLDKVVAKDAELRKKGQFRLLEIGIGQGANLNYYPKNSLLISLEPNESFKEYYEENKKKYPDLMVEKMLTGVAEDMKDIPNESIDVVVCTHVLCSASDIDLVLQEVKRVLCKDGQFLFLEHIAAPNDTMLYKLQQILEPVWKVIFAGCQLTCDTEAHMQKAGFTTVEAQTVVIPEMLPLFARQIFGKMVK